MTRKKIVRNRLEPLRKIRLVLIPGAMSFVPTAALGTIECKNG